MSVRFSDALVEEFILDKGEKWNRKGIDRDGAKTWSKMFFTTELELIEKLYFTWKHWLQSFR